MAKYAFVRGDRYAITLPVTKDNVAFDLTSWTATCTLGQDDVIIAKTEAEVPTSVGPLAVAGKTTLTVQPGNGSATMTICNSALLDVGDYVLELRATNGTLVYTWPVWSLSMAEPQGI